MKLIDLEVHNFGRVRSAEVTFGPGLNVLHGRNDLGKSTLVRAIRAALLLPYGSKEAHRFIPWSGGGTPYVKLTFEVPEGGGTQYRVSKKFGARADLEEKPRGASWRRAARNRQVDEKLREVLRWGIEAPGRGGQRGIPTSFLATVLLADQDEVEAVLKVADLQSDRGESGREWLTDVLEASAVDPGFLKTLEEVERNYYKAYTTTGRRARAQGSPLKRLADQINATRKELEAVEEKHEKLEGVRRALAEAREAAAEVEDDLAKSRAHLAGLQSRSQEAKAKEQLAAELADAKAAFFAALQRNDEVEEAELAAEQAAADVKEVERWVRTAEALASEQTQAVGRAQAAVAGAAQAPEAQGDTILRLEQQRALDALSEELAAFERDLQTAGELRRLAADITAAQAERDELTAAAATAAEAMRARSRRESDAKAQRDVLEYQLAALTLRDVDLEIEAHATRLETLQQAAEEAAKALADAHGAVEGATGTELPDRATVTALQTLFADLREARAAVELGLAVSLRPAQELTVEARADADASERHNVTAEQTWTALREVQLSIEGVGDLHIQAGSEAKRTRAAELAARWKAEALPVLERAGVEDLASLAVRVDTHAQAQLEAETRLAQAQSRQPSQEQLEATQTALDAARARRPAALAAMEEAEERVDIVDDDLPSADELQEQRQQLDAELATLRASIVELRVERSAAEASLTASKTRLRDLSAAWDKHPEPLRDGWQQLLDEADERRASLHRRRKAAETELHELSDRKSEGLVDREDTLAADRELEEAMRERARTLRELQADLRDHRTRCDADLEHLRASSGPEAVERARATMRAAQEAVDAKPRQGPVTEAEIEFATDEAEDLALELEALLRDVHAYDVQLKGDEGRSVAQERADLHERCERLEAQERALELEYEGWAVLREVMLEVQEDLTSNLGSALAPQVQRRFDELASDPYTLSISSSLKTEGVMVAGEARDPNALSVGTRDQLATLFRLALAEQLGSVVVLDDQLVHSDPGRMEVLLSLLNRAATRTQVVVLTCRPDDYASPDPSVQMTDLAPVLNPTP